MDTDFKITFALKLLCSQQKLSLNSKPSIKPLLTACGLPAGPVKNIDFEVPNIVNPYFTVAPHLDVQISFDDGPWDCAGIEAKFCEATRSPVV